MKLDEHGVNCKNKNEFQTENLTAIALTCFIILRNSYNFF
jgi:hypothetical protein